MNYYVYENKTLIGIKDKKEFNKYLLSNDGECPLIKEGIIKIKENVFKGIKGIKKIYIPSTVRYLDAKILPFRLITINYGNYYKISTKDMTPERKKMLCLRINEIMDIDLFNDYLDKHDGHAPRIPNGICFIGEYVFKGLKKLKNIVLPETLTAIYKQSFMDSNIEELVISPRCVYYGEEAFKNCKKLKKIDIPTTMCYIKPNVFSGCDNLKIKVFDKFICDEKDFTLDTLYHLKEDNRRTRCKKLRTNKGFYLLLNHKPLFISLEDIKHVGFDRLLGQEYNDVSYIVNQNKGDKALYFYRENKEMPYGFIICATMKKDIKKYYKNIEIFKKNILMKVKVLSDYKTLDNKGVMVERLTPKQYEVLYKVAVVAGLFEHANKTRVTNLFLQDIFTLNKNYNGLSLGLDEFTYLFQYIGDEVTYSEEFSEYFLYNNLGMLVKKLKEDPKFLPKLYSNCGKSNVKYEHDGVWIDSLGLLHDEWLKYRANNNFKEVNVGLEKENKSLSFIDWALLYGDGSKLLRDTNFKNKEILNKFSSFYNEIEPYYRLEELFTESSKLIDYAYIDSECIVKSFNVSRIGLKPIYRDIEMILDDPKLNLELAKNKNMYTYSKGSYQGIMVKKSDPVFAYANCVMANCCNVMANGTEYLYESYLDKDCQPFLIYDEANPIASFRIDLDRTNDIAVINCLEVSTDLKYNYKDSEKEKIIEVFDRIVNNYIELYNRYNKRLKRLTMGQVTHCGINEELGRFYKVLDKPVIANNKRKVVAPNVNNHFLIWGKE